mgnify:CR=1 FL=1
MKELMEFLKNRPQTWSQRREQLESEDRIGRNAPGPYPHLLQLCDTKSEPIFWEARRIIDVPIAISEERYPDEPDTAFMYWTGECKDASDFWHIYFHLHGFFFHKCDDRCVMLPKFIMEGHRE